jgi:hypothetical protein
VTKEEIAGIVRTVAGVALSFAVGKGWLVIDPATQVEIAAVIAALIAAWSVQAKRS